MREFPNATLGTFTVPNVAFGNFPEPRSEVAPALLLALDRLEQRLEVADAEAE
ncbi:hypothetical protein SAMN05216266_12475 [Amycolatopsis marina]|uniref:Uncharacterized protein n=1 Tax=Amycolatopsis marina TaxID=490629 RepID=A0A1I1CGN5_9PSEU|nr:hypothetical protein SAMN05216266_12475 [Amycolatopsis marina]